MEYDEETAEEVREEMEYLRAENRMVGLRCERVHKENDKLWAFVQTVADMDIGMSATGQITLSMTVLALRDKARAMLIWTRKDVR